MLYISLCRALGIAGCPILCCPGGIASRLDNAKHDSAAVLLQVGVSARTFSGQQEQNLGMGPADRFGGTMTSVILVHVVTSVKPYNDIEEKT